jgi:hypothetical protein
VGKAGARQGDRRGGMGQITEYERKRSLSRGG